MYATPGEAVFCLLVLVLSWLAVGSGRSGRVCLRIQCDDSALYLARLGATFAFILRLLQGRLSQSGGRCSAESGWDSV